MIERQPERPCLLVAALGAPPARNELPPVATRWVIGRKADVVAAVAGGLLSMDDACKRYGLTLGELASWQSAVERFGIKGLRVTQGQYYRDLPQD
jgi:hypothetical protein